MLTLGGTSCLSAMYGRAAWRRVSTWLLTLLTLRENARVDGLMVGVYLVYAPWRPPG